VGCASNIFSGAPKRHINWETVIIGNIEQPHVYLWVRASKKLAIILADQELLIMLWPILEATCQL
jgi:hypothetical protein